MKQIRTISFTILFCLLLSVVTLSAAPDTPKKVTTPFEDTVQSFLNNDYEMLMGPVQYLGKTDSSILLYRLPAVTYDRVDVINQFGEAWFLRKNDFIYILSKRGHLVLIRVHEKEEDKNAK